MTAAAPSPRRAGAPHNASADDGYACCALVSAAGTVEEASGPEGAHVLRGAPALVGYARALLAAGRPAVRFWWRSPQAEWLNVTIAAVQGDPDQAEVTLERSAPPYDLTSRELDVLTLIAGGLSNQEIASRLFTSPKTVSTHVEHLLHKLGTPTRAGAAAIAAEQGAVRLPVPGRGHRLESLADRKSVV